MSSTTMRVIETVRVTPEVYERLEDRKAILRRKTGKKLAFNEVIEDLLDCCEKYEKAKQ